MGTCYLVDHSGKKNKFNFFKSACISFLKFKKMNLLINMDGKEYTFNKVWFTTVMNGKYFGGGMKLTPDSIREDDILELIVIDKVKLIPLILIFPTIYLGWHYFFKRYVHHFKVKEVDIKVLNGKYTYQHDGETIRDIDHFHVKKG